MNIMKTFDSLNEEDQEIAKAMSDAARTAMGDMGIKPANDDRAAHFDEACAVFLVDSRKKSAN